MEKSPVREDTALVYKIMSYTETMKRSWLFLVSLQHFETADKDIKSKIQNKKGIVIGEVEGLRKFPQKDVMEVEVYMDFKGNYWKIANYCIVPLAHSRKDVCAEVVAMCRTVARPMPLMHVVNMCMVQ